MKSIVTETFAFYTFDEGLFTQQRKTFCLQDGFVLAIRLRDLPQQEGKSILLKTEGFELSYTCKNAQDKEQFCEKADRPWIYANKNGVVRALEMKIESISPYENEAREMVCELLVELFNPVQKTAYFVYDGVRVFWVYDGEIVNANYPFGRLVIGENIRNCTALVKSWRLAPLAAVRKEERTQIVQKNMAFYSPRGYNVWAGDVMSFYKDDTYRLLYFYDRHHHSSRYGGGAHTVYQITTKDFVHWQECGELVPLDEQWKTVGTGNMFFYDGKYYYVHGWHTSRMVPVEKTGKMLLLEKSTQDEIHGASYAQIAERGLIPSGANFCVSCDGVHFESGEYQFHTVENPSVYVEKDGSLTLYGGYGGEGVWHASNIKGPWKRTGDFAMNKSPLKPSTECPCRFEYNGYKYLLVGGTGFWMTQKGDDAFKDVAKEGYDIYDGMFVPTVTQTGDNRLIYAGWLRGYGWGSVVVHRELIQGEKGRLYMRWLPELAPQKDELEEVTGDTLDDKSSYYIEADTTTDMKQFRMTDDTHIYVDAAIEAPLDFDDGVNVVYSDTIDSIYIEEFTLKSLLLSMDSTTEINVDSTYDAVDSVLDVQDCHLQLFLTLENYIPFEVMGSFRFYNENDSLITFNGDSTRTQYDILLDCPTDIVDGEVVTPVENELVLAIAKGDFKNISSIRKIVFTASIGKNAVPAKLTTNSALRAYIGVAADVSAIVDVQSLFGEEESVRTEMQFAVIK